MDEVLRLDTISVEITSYIRDDPLEEAVTVAKDDFIFVIVPNAFSLITLSVTQDI